MKAISALVAVIVLFAIAYLAGPSAKFVFGVAIPYAAIAIFIAGVIYRVAFKWGKAPVPFAIATTCGQQKSHPWIKHASIENPTTTGGVLARMALEVFFFRSLFRNTKMSVKEGPKVTYDGEWILWAAALAFHYSFLVIILRHMRFFTDPIPFFVEPLQWADGFFEIGVPSLYITGAVLVGAVGVLFLRRLFDPHVRYISLVADYFRSSSSWALDHRHPHAPLHEDGYRERQGDGHEFGHLPATVPDGIAPIFYAHVFLVCVLLAYFPFSKLTHMAGVFMSPTRNMRCNTREVRHINPWNHPVRVHTYAEYEDDFREKMKACDLPVDKEESDEDSKGDDKKKKKDD